MREIKFRYWDKINRVMVQNIHDSEEFWLVINNNLYDVMQYTGLKDKNGKEIYEEDILRNDDDEIAKVQYSEEDAMFEIIIDNISTNFRNENSKWWEVVGTIYDN